MCVRVRVRVLMGDKIFGQCCVFTFTFPLKGSLRRVDCLD